MKEIPKRHMIALKAYAGKEHQHDISRMSEDLCAVFNEDDDNYYGQWVEGLGFFNVKFPKKTTRPLTDEEFDKYNGKKLAINAMEFGELEIIR